MSGALEGELVLDLGCGFGWFEQYAVASACSRVLGVDKDRIALERAKREVPEVELIPSNATAIREDRGDST
jgi:predicted RNA methylase